MVLATRNHFRALVLLVCGLLVACTGTEILVPSSLALTPADTTIHQGGQVQLVAAAQDSSGRAIPTGVRATFTSSDSVIATVSETGLVRSSGLLGTVTITARFGVLLSNAVIRIVDSSIVQRLPLSGLPFGIALSSTTAYVTRVLGNAVQRLDLSSETFVASVPVGAEPTRVAFSRDGRTAYVSNQGSQTVGVIDVAASAQEAQIPTHGDPVPLQVTADQRWLFVTTNTNRLYKVDLATHGLVDSVALPATSHFLLLHPNDTLLYVATRDGGSVMEINWRTMTTERTMILGGSTLGMALSPDRRELYVANYQGAALNVVTLATGTVTSIPLAGSAFGLALGPDGTKLYVGLPLNGMVPVIDRVTRRVVKTIVTTGVPREIAVDSARKLVIVPNEAGWVDLMR